MGANISQTMQQLNQDIENNISQSAKGGATEPK